jgi:hypothetical protein
MNQVSRRVVQVLLAFVLLQPILALGHELLVVLVATLLGAFTKSNVLYQIINQVFASPVHATIMIETLGGIRAEGIAVIGWIGQILHNFFPSLFIDSSAMAPSAWISAIIDKDSTVLGFYATQATVEFLLIVLGLLILRIGLKQRSIGNIFKDAPVFDVVCTSIGLFVVAQAIWSALCLTLFPAVTGLRETELGVGFSLLLQMDRQRYDWLMDESLPILIPITLVGTAVGIGWLGGKLLDRIQAAVSKPSPQSKHSLATRLVRKAHLALALGPLLLVSAISPRYFGIANTTLVTPALQVSPSPAQSMVFAAAVPPTPTPALPAPTITSTPVFAAATATISSNEIVISRPTATNTPTLIPSPTHVPKQVQPRQVELKRNGNNFSLLVNGNPTYVKGLNYNVNYTALPNDIKRNFHQRDFQIMQNAGVNAVIGWGVYDQVTLDIANDFGIGIIMPFDLDPQGAFLNKNYRDQIKSEFGKFVNKYKGSPALWGWNPGGDELLQRMETEQHRTPDKIQAAADFLLELSTLAYSLDPNHVSIVKEPRNHYVPYFEDALRRARKQQPASDPSKFFVFGSNVYGRPDSVASVLDATKQSIEDRAGIALVVGEFAPFGLARRDRADHYAMMWNTVRQTSSIGGFAYVFGPDQPNPKAPNPYDPLRLLVSEFSLVDNEGLPVDGSLDALATLWRQ